MENRPPKDWPSYPIGPKEGVFAIGVASTKFTELESILSFLFGTVFGMVRDDATMIVSKIGNEAAVALMQQKIIRRPSEEERDAPPTPLQEQAADHLAHFIKAFNVCLENRNHLMHSGLAWTGTIGDPILFKTTKQGRTHASAPTLDELRGVADDIHRYCDYGRAIGNAINLRLSDPPIFSGAVFPWPDKSPLPRSLRYTQDAIPRRP
jgi:hypothetical protein